MMSNDRTLKVLLALICLALWGIVLKPFLKEEPALAQSRKQYEMEMYNIDSGGWGEAKNDLKDKPRQGWRVSSMTTYLTTTIHGGVGSPILLILWEK
jgi:hypothetical protein